MACNKGQLYKYIDYPLTALVVGIIYISLSYIFGISERERCIILFLHPYASLGLSADEQTSSDGYILDAFTKLEFSQIFVMKMLVFVAAVYAVYVAMVKPFNKVRKLGDLGYIPEMGLNLKQTANLVRRTRRVGEIPPVFPNGWFTVLESYNLKVGEARAVSCLGLNLAVFRGEDGQAHIIDAYCPHMGANLAAGGRVKGDCLECPFHGWRFRGKDGKCTLIPYTDAPIPESAKVKTYLCLERNNLIHIWHHAEGAGPDWEPPIVKEIDTGEWGYRGRVEYHINTHLEEISENGADMAHFSFVHSPSHFAGIDLRYITTSKLWSFINHVWNGEIVSGTEKHVREVNLCEGVTLWGRRLKSGDVTINTKQIGPGLVFINIKTAMSNTVMTMSLTPIQPLLQRVSFNMYTPWTWPTWFCNLFLLGHAIMFERDIMIWNNKQYNNKPLFVRAKEDSQVAKQRRWHSQFYSENSPRFSFKTETLDW